MLKMSMIGRLGADAELKEVEKGRFIAMSVVEVTADKDKKGQWVRATMSVRDTTDISNFLQYLKKGKEVYLDGIPHVRAYLDKEGKPQSELCLYVQTIQLIGRKSDSE